MLKKIVIYIIYTIWLVSLIFNTIFVFITWENTLVLGQLYYCSEQDKNYIRQNIDIDYDFDYISVGLTFHNDYRIIAVKKNFICLPNIITGTETIIQINQKGTSEVYNYFEQKLENTEKISENIFYEIHLIIYIVCGISYIFIKKQLDRL